MIRLAPVLAAMTAACTAMIMFGASAQAHVEVEASDARAGARNAVLTFTAESESTRAGIVSLRVKLPDGISFADLKLLSAPTGWRLSASDAGYTVSGPAVPVGKDASYTLRVARLPDAPVIRFPTIQTYSDGHVDTWIEVPADPTIEPEAPAPALTLAGASAPTAAHSTATVAGDADGSNSPSVTLYVILGAGVALIVITGAAILHRRGKRS